MDQDSCGSYDDAKDRTALHEDFSSIISRAFCLFVAATPIPFGDASRESMRRIGSPDQGDTFTRWHRCQCITMVGFTLQRSKRPTRACNSEFTPALWRGA